MRVGMLTRAGGAHGRRILAQLAARGLRLHALVYEAPLRLRRSVIRDGGRPEGWGSVAVNAPRHLGSWLRARSGVEDRDLSQYAEVVVRTGPLNSERMLRDLRRLELDLLLLGDVGILDEPLLETPRAGTLNVHPGLLPWVRGTGVVGRALQRGVPVGCSCHYVDRMIDTGPIIERRLLPMDASPATLDEVEARADELAAATLAGVVEAIAASGELPRGTAQARRYPCCRWLSARQRAELDLLLRNGLGGELFRSWVAAGRCDEQFVLHPEIHALPGEG